MTATSNLIVYEILKTYSQLSPLLVVIKNKSNLLPRPTSENLNHRQNNQIVLLV